VSAPCLARLSPAAAVLLLALALVCALPAVAQETPTGTVAVVEAAPAAVPPPELEARAAVLQDAATGTVLAAKNADEPISPASLTKLVTMKIALEEAAARGLPLDAPMETPPESWAQNQPPRSSLMWLGPDQTVTLNDLLLGLAIPSGNDAAVAVALNFAPTVPAFVDRMNTEAARLGLAVTRFVEPSGIDEANMTTAREFAVFCRDYVTTHPEALVWHSTPSFAFPRPENVPAWKRGRPGTIVTTNHNGLLGEFPGVDGLKTGYIDEAGYNIALTAERDGTRFVAVILGVPASLGGYRGPRRRDADGRALLTWGFDNFHTLRPEAPPLPAQKLWKGKMDAVAVAVPDAEPFTAPTDRGGELYWEALFDEAPLIAPLPAGSQAGSIVLSDPAGVLRTWPIVTTEEAEKGGFWKRLWHSILLFFK